MCPALLLTSCGGHGKAISVITTDIDNEYSCHLNSNGKTLGISNVRKYVYSWLVEYQGCASEGLYKERFNPPFYSKGEPMTRLSLKISENEATLFGENYKIARETKDSIFLKNKEEYFIIVGEGVRQ